MKKKTALIGVCFIAASTIGLTFIQPTIIHQLVIWVAGMFALLVVLAVFAVDNATEGDSPTAVRFTEDGRYDAWVLNRTKRGRDLGATDEEIARVTGIDIDVIKAIPR